MQLNVKIGVNEIWNLIKQLPEAEIEKLSKSIKKELLNKSKTSKKIKVQELILNAPTWTDFDYSNYLKIRKHLNQSRLS